MISSLASDCCSCAHLFYYENLNSSSEKALQLEVEIIILLSEMFGKINLGLTLSQSSSQSKPFLQKANHFAEKSGTQQLSAQSSSQKQINKQSAQSKQENSLKSIAKTKKIEKSEKSQLQAKDKTTKNKTKSLDDQMQGSKFRILNEILYSNSSDYAMQYFKDNLLDYQIYHKGYRLQSETWESKPVHTIIKHFRKNFKEYRTKIICDLGCGQGFIYEELTRKKFSNFDQATKTMTSARNKHAFPEENILSFDLVALKDFIKVADIKSLPLAGESVDVTVFCLSLMGKNYLDFITEAFRILKDKTGELIIAEVQSRSKSWKGFVQMIQNIGFNLVNNGVSLGSNVEYGHQEAKKIAQNKGKYFRVLHFVKDSSRTHSIKKIKFDGQNFDQKQFARLSQLLLTECIYKRR